MYRCPLCGVQSKAFNVLCSSHYRKHKDQLSPQEYKRQLLITNGRIPPICPICGLETTIPKGEKDFPKYHRRCYFKSIDGASNPHYKGGKQTYQCANCDKFFDRYGTQHNGDRIFCSISCSRLFYSKTENYTDAIRRARIQQVENIKRMASDPAVRQKIAEGQARAFKGGRSQLEKDVYARLSTIWPDAIFSHQIDYYVVDIFIPSLNQVVEVQGDYWHSLPEQASKDRGKLLFLTNKGYKVSYIWEHEWEAASDKDQLIKACLKRLNEPVLPLVQVIVVGGVSGSGKSWICNQLKDRFAFVEYDKISKKELYNSIFRAGLSGKTVLVDMHNGISTFVRRSSGRFKVSLVCIDEPLDQIRGRLEARGGTLTHSIVKRARRIKRLAQLPYCIFSGTSQEVYSFLSSW